MAVSPEFQSSFAELIIRGVPGDRSLSVSEKHRIDDLASQGGVRVMRTLYFSWRLTKILSLLPLTSALLGEHVLAQNMRSFWDSNKATSLYFVDECLAFLLFLESNLGEAPPYFHDVATFERARLELRSAQSRGQLPHPRYVRFACDPAALFDTVTAGGDTTHLPRKEVELRGELSSDGEERWIIVGSSS